MLLLRPPSISKSLPARARGTGPGLRPGCSAIGTAAGLGVDAAKAVVRTAVGGTLRGKSTSEEQRRSILQHILHLEALNPTPNPTDSPLVSGAWALLYQAPLDEARAKVDKSGTTEGLFLALFQPLTKNLIRTKTNLQLIDLDHNRVENLAEFVIANRWDGFLNIVGKAEKMEPQVAGGPAVRIRVEFIEFVLKVGGTSFKVPLFWIKAQGWVETTFVDEDMRVGRGDKGSIFVASRLKESRWPGAKA